MRAFRRSRGGGLVARTVGVLGASVLLTVSAGVVQADATAARAPAVARGVATAGVAAVPRGVAAAAATVAAKPPAWLTSLSWTYMNGDTERHDSFCTAVLVSSTRVLLPADCPNGRSASDYSSLGFENGAGDSYATYRTDQQYNSLTRQDDLAVYLVADPTRLRRIAPAPLANASDWRLYRPGTAAQFWYWTPGSDGLQSKAVSQQVVVEPASWCAVQSGQALAPGSVCTAPAPGSAPAPAAASCAGDAGGALVADGLLIGLSATPVHGCPKSGVRVYTAIDTHYALVEGWVRYMATDPLWEGSLVATDAAGVITSECESWAVAILTPCLAGDSGEFVDPWRQYNLLMDAGDLDGSGYGDMIARSNSGGLYVFTRLGQPGVAGGQSDLSTATKHYLGAGWNAYDTILAPGDLNGDGLPDLLARDHHGNLWLYPGNGHGGFGTRVWVSGGWNAYNLLTASGDLSGDGIPDLVARDRSGRLWMFRGNGHGGFQPGRAYLGANWAPFNAVVAAGAADDLGRNQIVGRMPNGWLDIFTATGNGGLSAGHWERGNPTLTTARLT